MELKWLKLASTTFDDEKICLIDSLPDRDSIELIWIKILCLLGKLGSTDGKLILGGDIPLSAELLEGILHRSRDEIERALQVFIRYKMIVINDGIISVPNWEKHQSLEAAERKRMLARERKAKQRERERENAEHKEEPVAQPHDTPESSDIIEVPVPELELHGRYNNVELTEEELAVWRRECPQADRYIEKLSSYLESSGKSYKNHLAVLRRWYLEDREREKHNPPQTPAVPRTYDIESFMNNSLGNLEYIKKKDRNAVRS